MSRILMAVGVIWWAFLAGWLVRLGMDLEHLSRDRLVPGAVVGAVGGLGACLLVPRVLREEAAR
ncbi:hypothetical protein [Paludisphaera soli]|uniref:hypothetical protein n=1 Tax=Paludisphaera soli TaxID=2712865 RepID=UPI0013EE1305|nr:hypothetical protein [Paludisphaera soli]